MQAQCALSVPVAAPSREPLRLHAVVLGAVFVCLCVCVCVYVCVWGGNERMVSERVCLERDEANESQCPTT